MVQVVVPKGTPTGSLFDLRLDLPQPVKDFFSNIATFFVNIGNAIRTALESLANFLLSLPQRIHDALKWIADQIYNAFVGFASWLYEGIRWLATQIWNILVRIWNALVDAFTWVYNKIVETFGNIVKSINGFISGLIIRFRSRLSLMIASSLMITSAWKYFEKAEKIDLKTAIKGVGATIGVAMAGYIIGEIISNLIPLPKGGTIQLIPEITLPTITPAEIPEDIFFEEEELPRRPAFTPLPPSATATEDKYIDKRYEVYPTISYLTYSSYEVNKGYEIVITYPIKSLTREVEKEYEVEGELIAH